jgi:hypothetical protein
MEEHPIIAFVSGGGFLMALVVYTVKDLLSKIDYLKKKTHEQDVKIAIMENELKQLKR